MNPNPKHQVRKNDYRQVLDDGFVRFIDSMGDDLSIVRNARVSYNSAWRTGENEDSDTRLIRYLMNNGHNTPFESVTVTFEVKAPIFVLRQWHRHRTQSYNELSARYRPLPEEFYIPDVRVLGRQSKDNKQMRDISEELSTEDIIRAGDATRRMRASMEQSFKTYRMLLESGVPRELARSVLPVATYSHMFATANLHNWFGFLRERLHPHAQYEIRMFAEAIFYFLEGICPVATQAFSEKEGV